MILGSRLTDIHQPSLKMVGSIQALVEMAYRSEDSTCVWDLTEDGDLTVSIKVLEKITINP